MLVNHFNREARPNNFTFEQLFGAIRNELRQQGVIINNYDLPSNISKISSLSYAFLNRGELNHITGDVHFLAYALKNKKNILTIHDIGYYLHQLIGLKKIIYKKIWLTDPCRIVDKVTVISQETKNQLMEFVGLEEDKIKVIYNPLLPGFTPIKRGNNLKPTILQIGSGENKNVLRLIQAVKGLNVRLILINNFSDKRIIDALINNSIDFEQRINLNFNQLLKTYAESDILYFASEYEGFGMPIIESQAIGRPVITSNISSMPEIGGVDSCFYINPYNIEEIRHAVKQLIGDETLYSSLVNKGFDNCLRFDIKSIAKDYLDLYNSLI